MGPDDHVCLCFRVSQRKIIHFLLRERPPVASMISQCLSAGTGCGWCIPYLERLHAQVLREDPDAGLPIASEEYARRRLCYHETGQRELDP